MNSRQRYRKSQRTKGKKMFRSFSKRAYRLRTKAFSAVSMFLLMLIPASMLAATNVPFDTKPEPFQGSDRLVNFLNKFQFALIIILVILFVLGVMKLAADHKSGKGVKAEAVGIALAVFGIIVVTNPSYWINLIGSWFGG